jgi:hypothetical protein
MVEVEMNQAQLIRSIEQQLENLMHFDDDLAYQYECELYYDCNDDEEATDCRKLHTRTSRTTGLKLFMNSTMTDYGFYTEQEIKELADSDLSFEIADAALLKTPEADEYMHLLIQELKRRND